MRKGSRERIEKESRERAEKGSREDRERQKRERDKRELRRQLEKGLKEIKNFTWTSNTRKSLASHKYNFTINYSHHFFINYVPLLGFCK